MKLGIACVYFYGEEDSWMLDLQLREIARFTKGYDFTVYAAANRLWPSLRDKLEACDFVEIVDLPETNLQGGPEHGAYLDALVRHAVAEGCSHICTLDCDSFPVQEGWPTLLADQLSGGLRLAAVLRLENLDKALPHPSGYFMDASFAKDHDAAFWPDDTVVASPTFQAFLAETGERVDTGIGYAYSLWRKKEDWLKLPRTNKQDLHFLMAGIYGDVFFHFGASSRAPAFARDYQQRPLLRFSETIAKWPLVWRIGKFLNDRYREENAGVQADIRHRLSSDPQTLYAVLRGEVS